MRKQTTIVVIGSLRVKGTEYTFRGDKLSKWFYTLRKKEPTLNGKNLFHFGANYSTVLEGDRFIEKQT